MRVFFLFCILLTPLALFSQKAPTPDGELALAIAAADVARVEKAIESGADLLRGDSMGRTPLILAAMGSSPELIVRVAKGNLDALDKGDLTFQTPLMYACAFTNIEGVKALLTLKPEIHKTARTGATALSIAKRVADKEIIEALKSAGAQR